MFSLLFLFPAWAKLPEIKITRNSCESYLLADPGARLRRRALKALAQMPPSSRRIDETRIVGSLVNASPAPFEYFDERFAGLSQEDLDALMRERINGGWSLASTLLGGSAVQSPVPLPAPVSDPDIVNAALNLDAGPTARIGQIDFAVVDGKVTLVTHSRSGAVIGHVALPLDQMRLGYPDALAQWQAGRHYRNPAAFARTGIPRATTDFLIERGALMFERQIGDRHLGYMIFLNSLLGSWAKDKTPSLRFVTLSDRPRTDWPSERYVFPNAERLGEAEILGAEDSFYSLGKANGFERPAAATERKSLH